MSEREDQTWERVVREHEEHPHQGITGARMRLHLAVHVVVERQLLERDPPQVGETLARLVAEGLDRHGAVHAIGRVASEEVIACLSRGEPYDEERYVNRLRELSARETEPG